MYFIQSCVHTSSCVFSSPDSPVLTSRVAVTVHVLDINEFPPELASPYETFVCENAKAGQVRPHFPPFPRLVMWTRDELPALNAANIVVLRRVDLSASRQLLIGVLLFLLLASRWSLENRLEVIN